MTNAAQIWFLGAVNCYLLIQKLLHVLHRILGIFHIPCCRSFSGQQYSKSSYKVMTISFDPVVEDASNQHETFFYLMHLNQPHLSFDVLPMGNNVKLLYFASHLSLDPFPMGLRLPRNVDY